MWLHLDSESLRGFWLWCLKPTARPEPKPEPERYGVISAWMLWLVKVLRVGGFTRLKCCAWKEFRFIRPATGCCGLGRP